MSKEKERIVFLSNLDFPNGLGNTMRIKLMSKAFIHVGYDVSLFMAYAPGTVSWGLNYMAEGNCEGIEYKYCNGSPDPPKNYFSRFSLKTIGFLRVLREVWKIHNTSNVKYIYLYGTHGTIFYEDISYWVLSRIIRAKIIVDVNDAVQLANPKNLGPGHVQYYLRALKYLLIRIKGDFIIRRADFLFYVSGYLRQSIYKKVKCGTKLLFVPMLIDAKYAPKQFLRKTRNNTIGYAGFFKDYEGLDFLLDALKILHSSEPCFTCWLYGATQSNTMMVNLLNTMIEKSGLGEHVFIKDSVPHDRLFQVLALCDVLVVPRRSSVITLSGFAQKFGDYLLSGVPVVSTAVGEVVHLLENGKHIIFTPEGDPKAFAAAIEDLLYNEEKAHRIGMNGQMFARDNFDYRVVAREIENLLG